MTPITFFVPGHARTKGSKRIVHAKNGKSLMIESGEKLSRPWRIDVKASAERAMDGYELFTGPVKLTARFVFTRPQGHYHTGKKAGQLKSWVPCYFAGGQGFDLDKLLRLIGDCFIGVAFKDDSQIAEIVADKRYGETPGVTITIEPLDGFIETKGFP